MDGSIGEWMDLWKGDGWMNEWIGGWLAGLMDGLMDGWMADRVNG